MGLSQDSGISGRPSLDHDASSPASRVGPDDMLSILTVSLPAFVTTLGETDRITTAISSISTNVVSPIFRSRLFPNNVNKNVLTLLRHSVDCLLQLRVDQRPEGRQMDSRRLQKQRSKNHEDLSSRSRRRRRRMRGLKKILQLLHKRRKIRDKLVLHIGQNQQRDSAQIELCFAIGF